MDAECARKELRTRRRTVPRRRGRAIASPRRSGSAGGIESALLMALTASESRRNTAKHHDSGTACLSCPALCPRAPASCVYVI